MKRKSVTKRNIVHKQKKRFAATSTTSSLPMFRCRHCGYLWNPRVFSPKECPMCKNRKWEKINGKSR